MFKGRKPTLVQFVTTNIIIISLIFMSIFYFLWVRYENKRFNESIKDAKAIYLESKKEALKTIVEQFYLILKHQTVYEKKLISQRLNSMLFTVDFFDNIGELKKNCFNMKRDNRVMDFLCLRKGKVVFSSGEGLGINDLNNKKSFLIFRKKYLAKLKVTLFFVVFKKDFNEYIKSKLLNVFKDISFNYSGYLFIVDSRGRILLSAHRLMNTPIHKMSERFGKETERIILDRALNQGDGFVSYTWFKPDLKHIGRKISYIKFDRRLNWIFGAGIYLDDIEKRFVPIYENIKKEYRNNITKTTVLMIIILFLDVFLLLGILKRYFKADYKKIEYLFENFNNMSEDEIKDLDCRDLVFRETCLFASRVKENLIEVKKAHSSLIELNKQFKEMGSKFKAIADSISNGVAIVDSELFIEFVNPEFCKIFELREPEAVQGLNLVSLFPEKIKHQLIEILENVKGKGIRAGIENLSVYIGNIKKVVNLSLSSLQVENTLKFMCTINEISERERLLERLKFLTEQFEKAEDMAKVGNWIYYPEERKFWASNQCFKIYNIELTVDNRVPASWINNKIVADDMHIALKTTIEPIKNKRPFEGIFRISPSKGEVRYVASKGEPVFDKEGNVVMVQGVLMDITKLKRIELELEHQIEILEKTQMIARLGYWEYDFKGETFFIYSSFLNTLFGKNKIPKEEFFSIIVEEDRDKIKDFVLKGFKTKEKIADTFRVKIPWEKDERFVYFESDPVIQDDMVIKRIGWTQDITDIKTLEEKIEIEKSKLVNTINSLSEGVVVLDRDFNPVFVNQAFEMIFQTRFLEGEYLFQFFKRVNIHGLSSRINRENLFELLHKNLKYVYSDKSRELILTFDIKELKGKGVDEGGYVLIVEDITHKEKYTEEVIKTQNMRLINKIAASLAHDLNNLLGSILGKISLLEKKEKDIQFANELKKVIRNIKIARALATQFLTFSKSGKPLFSNLGKKSIEQIINDLSDFVFSGTSIVVNKDIPGDLWTIRGDYTQVAQVVLNLFSNARDALQGKGRIEVVLKNVEDEKPLKCPKGDYVLIRISDNGPGIPEDKVKEIFNFFVGYKKQGFGLGLAIVKSIVDSHNGCIGIKSEPGKGTEFNIYFPAIKETKPETFKEESEENEQPFQTAFLQDIKIVVLEDEQPMQETIYDLMEFLGVNGDIFATGEEVLEAVENGLKRNDRYHIAILDLTVKGGSGGKEIIGKLKSLDPDLIAIVSSGYSGDPVVARFREYGFDMALPKPYTFDEFKKVIEFCIKKIRGE